MKHIHRAAIVPAILLVTLLLPGMAPAAKTLRYSDHEPLEGRTRTRLIKDVFFAAIEKESNGRLIIDDHWNGEISISYNALRAVTTDGLADMAMVVPEYVPGDLPLHLAFKSFPTGPVGDKQIEFFHRVYAEIPAFTEELHNANVVNVFFSIGFPLAFYSTKPLQSLEETKGTAWRTASFCHRGFLENTGAIPVTLPWGEEVYAALRDGTMDGVMVNLDSGYHIKAHEHAPNVLVSRDLWLGHIYLLVMNKDTWEKLSQEDKDAIHRAAETAYKSMAAAMDKGFDEQVELLQQAGATVRMLDPKEVQDWADASRYEDVQDTWIKEQKDKGLMDVAATVDAVRALWAQYR